MILDLHITLLQIFSQNTYSRRSDHSRLCNRDGILVCVRSHRHRSNSESGGDTSMEEAQKSFNCKLSYLLAHSCFCLVCSDHSWEEDSLDT